MRVTLLVASMGYSLTVGVLSGFALAGVFAWNTVSSVSGLLALPIAIGVIVILVRTRFRRDLLVIASVAVMAVAEEGKRMMMAIADQDAWEIVFHATGMSAAIVVLAGLLTRINGAPDRLSDDP